MIVVAVAVVVVVVVVIIIMIMIIIIFNIVSIIIAIILMVINLDYCLIIKSNFVTTNSTTIDKQDAVVIIVVFNFIIKIADARAILRAVRIMKFSLINFILKKESIIIISINITIIMVLIFALRFEFNLKEVVLVDYFVCLIEQQIQIVQKQKIMKFQL